MPSLVNKNILITGGTGFIGTHLANALCRRNRVVVLGRHEGVFPLNPAIEFAKLDIRNPRSIHLVKRGSFDYIFHLAANADQKVALDNPTYDMEVNFLSTLRILDALRGLKRPPKFIFASSVTVYGDCPDTTLSEDRSVLQPISNYGASKLAAERYVYAFARQYDLPAITIRLFSTYGPGSRRMMVFDFIHRLSQNPHELSIIGSGKEARDLTYIDDQVKNIVTIAGKAKYQGEAYNSASGKLYTTTEVAKEVAKAMGVQPRVTVTKKTRVFDGRSWRADVKKIRTLGCRATTSLSRGIRETVEWYQQAVDE